MPTFKPSTITTSVVPDGCYVAKVIEAREQLSRNGNEMIIMRLQLAGSGAFLPLVLTFVEKARTAISAFCQSASMVFPDGDAGVRLTADDCLGRYLYIVVTNEADLLGAVSKVSRFVSRQEALVINPALSRVILKEQAPLQLSRAQPPTTQPSF